MTQSDEASDPSDRSGFVVAALFGIVAGVNNLGNGLAVAALLFAGPLASGYGLGLGVVLVGGIIFAVVMSLLGQLAYTVSEVQEAGIAILAAELARVASNLSGPPEVLVATGLAILGVSTLMTGGLFCLVGYFRLGGLVRFIPYPVIAGFLAGTGWMLLTGGISMVVNDGGFFAIFTSLEPPRVLAQMGTATMFAIFMIVLLRKISHPLAAPGLMVVAVAFFYCALWGAGIDLEQARAWGWLLEGSEKGSIVFPTPDMLLRVDWNQVASSTPIVLSVAVLSLIGVLLNTSGLELTTGNELDPNRELRANGLANLLAGAVGSPAGFTALGHTLLASQMGARGRGAGLATAAVLALGLMFSGQLISKIPIFLTSGLVMFLGLQLLYEWVVETRHRLITAEWSIVLGILLVIATVGFSKD